MEGAELDRFEWGDSFEVSVTKRSGEVRRETVKVIWIGDDRYSGGKVAIGRILRGRERADAKAQNGAAAPKKTPAKACPKTPPEPDEGPVVECDTCGERYRGSHECAPF